MFQVRLSPGARRNKIGAWTRDADGQLILRASVTAVPEKGKANTALIALLSKSWKIPKSRILIVRGETDRNKTLLLKDIMSAPPGAPL